MNKRALLILLILFVYACRTEAPKTISNVDFYKTDFFHEVQTKAIFKDSKTFTDLVPRSYEVIIQDDLGCTITQTVTITEPAALVASIGDSTPEVCLGDEDGTVTIDVIGGTPPYEFAVNSSDAADFAPNPSQYWDNLRGGDTYVIFVRDATISFL